MENMDPATRELLASLIRGEPAPLFADPLGDAARASNWPAQQPTQPTQGQMGSFETGWQNMPRAPIEDRRNEVMFPAPEGTYGVPGGASGLGIPGMIDEHASAALRGGRFDPRLIRDAVSENQLRYMDRTGHTGGNAYIDTPEMARRFGRAGRGG